jgi:phospholipid/cholesterol/gamma-HCH transport system substrate-binding protein
MRRSWASITVGALVLVVALISYKLIRSTSERNTASEGITVWALFHDASGLFEKSRVMTAGISVGQIEKRELDPKTAMAKITIRIAPNITLYENAVVTKKSASLLGEYYLEIDPGSELQASREKNAPPMKMRKLKDGDQLIHVIEPVAFGDMMASIGTLIPVMREILQDVRTLTSGPISDIANNVNELIERNSVVLDRLLSRVDHIAATVENVTTAEAGDVKESIKNVREITESIKSLIGTTHEQVAKLGEKGGGSIDKLQSSIDNLDKTMKSIEETTSKINEGKGTIGTLVNDDTIARNVEQITEDAGGFVRSITQLQTIVGLRSEYNFLTSSFKNYLSITLLPRPDKFYLIELVEDPRGYRTKTLTVVNNSQTGTSSETRVSLTEQLRFTLQFGKRVALSPNTAIGGRFGIKESTGGIAGDLYLFRDKLLLSVDVFDAKANRYPRIKATMQYAIWERNLFLIAGADDIANYVRAPGGGALFDYFAGLQLVFNDEDLRALLLFGGGAAAGAASK